MILRFIFTTIVIYLIYRVLRGIVRIPAKKEHESLLNTGLNTIQGGDLVQDPYCLTYIPEKEAYKVSIGEETLYFCSKTCFKKYQMEQKKQT